GVDRDVAIGEQSLGGRLAALRVLVAVESVLGDVAVDDTVLSIDLLARENIPGAHEREIRPRDDRDTDRDPDQKEPADRRIGYHDRKRDAGECDHESENDR